MSQLGCEDTGNKLQRQKKGPGDLGERKTRHTWGKERGIGMGVLRESACSICVCVCVCVLCNLLEPFIIAIFAWALVYHVLNSL